MRREYGIDLLKIVAMLLIVLDHILLWGGWGFCAGRTGIKGFALESLDALCLCHVNCFILASGWVMSRLEFKVRRIIRLWLEVWGYSLAFLILAFCVPSVHICLKDVVKNLLPISQDRYWFFTQYTILFFAMPILNVAIKNLERRTLCMILTLGFVCFSLHPFIFKTDIFHLNRGYSALWFIYLYLLSGTMATRGLFVYVSKKAAIGLALLGWWGGIVVLHVREMRLFGLENGFCSDLFRAYNCPFILLYSVAMLLIFVRLANLSERLKSMTAIVAPSVFAVYVIHSNPLFRVMTDWNVFWTKFLLGHSLAVCVTVSTVTAVMVFAVCIGIDRSRNHILLLLRGEK